VPIKSSVYSRAKYNMFAYYSSASAAIAACITSSPGCPFSSMNQQPDYDVEKTALIKELSLLGIKHTPEKLCRLLNNQMAK
jgi:hypothetical protein